MASGLLVAIKFRPRAGFPGEIREIWLTVLSGTIKLRRSMVSDSAGDEGALERHRESPDCRNQECPQSSWSRSTVHDLLNLLACIRSADMALDGSCDRRLGILLDIATIPEKPSKARRNPGFEDVARCARLLSLEAEHSSDRTT